MYKMVETIKCKCGIYVSGRTKNILKANLKRHKESQLHANQIARRLLGGRTEAGKSNEEEKLNNNKYKEEEKKKRNN